MSIDALKQELAGLAVPERSQIMAYLLALQDAPDDAYRATLARKIDDRDPKHWVSLEEFDRRLAAGKGCAAKMGSFRLLIDCDAVVFVEGLTKDARPAIRARLIAIRDHAANRTDCSEPDAADPTGSGRKMQFQLADAGTD